MNPCRVAWTDATSHSRNSVDRTPRKWELRIAGIILAVHRHIHYSPRTWLVTVTGTIQYGPRELQTTGDGTGADVAAAQSEAIQILAKLLADIQASLRVHS